MMKAVIAPDSFKGSMTSIQAAEAIKEGLIKVNPSYKTVLIPMADGGEGTVEALCAILNGELVSAEVRDPLGRRVTASYGWLEETSTAVIETAAASGLPLLKNDELNPAIASTYGTGELVKKALDRGAKRIIIGLGGSATVDGGTGFLQALGVRFFDQNGKELDGGGGMLSAIDSIDSNDLDQRLRHVEIIAASDVTNPLLGTEGAVSVFGPQKGVSEDRIAQFETGMEHFAEKTVAHTGVDYRMEEGSGAAGGFGYALHSFLHPVFESGFKIIAKLSNLEAHIKEASIVFTGEGKVDAQSLYGKVPIGISRIAREHGVPTVAFTGKIEGNLEKAAAEGLSLVMPIVDEPMSLESAMENGSVLLEKAASRLMKIYELIHENKGENR
ncbi:glycerate kinase [Rossellomorea sp. NS-SX7]|uniref:glycerate kinase n=1 Tax=Rossellomorea sp. NS-SX7 TaxID=3463856 RepID=UPI004058D323